MIFDHHPNTYWGYEQRQYGPKLEKHEIDHVTLYMTLLRNEIRECEKMIHQNVRLIREGEKILNERGINLPNWHDGDTKSEIQCE